MFFVERASPMLPSLPLNSSLAIPNGFQMQSKIGSTILYLVCLTLGALFLMSLVISFNHPPAKIHGWLLVAAKAFGLHNVYDVMRFKSKDSASSLTFIAFVCGALLIFQSVHIAITLGPTMQAHADTMESVNAIIWTTIAIALIHGCVYCLCGAAFWLPAVKKLLIGYQPEDFDDDELNSEMDKYGVSLGPAITMSGPEFLEWLKENQSDQPLDGIGLYIKIPESLVPEERHKKYANPIGSFLQAEELGYVNGGGTLISTPKKQITHVGIDVVMFDRETGIEAVVEILRQLNAPSETEIYVDDEVINVWRHSV